MMGPTDDAADRTADLLALADVKRWGVIKTLRNQSVAEHSFNVAVLVLELCHRFHYANSGVESDALKFALVHDAPETLTGDIDGKFKREYPELAKSIGDAEIDQFGWWIRMRRGMFDARDNRPYWLVKLADRVEALIFIKTWGIGPRAEDVYTELYNITMVDTVDKAAVALMIPQPEMYSAVYHIIMQSMTEANGVQLRRLRKVQPSEESETA